MRLKWVGAIAFLALALYYTGVQAWGNPVGQLLGMLSGS